MPVKALVSCCLAGLKTRYDASDNYSKAVIDFLKKNNITPIPVCPEQLAGLSTPRPKCWFKRGDGRSVLKGDGTVQDEQGHDLTAKFIDGAEKTLQIARLCDCRLAILQQRSPSCGTKDIYLNQELTAGMGITAALLEEHGIQVYSDENLPTQKELKSFAS